ncbi:MAG TPA: c-type cytochrome [Gammaproteobacteria bacterium]|nr:c-type cytochrome [Gammaproteobacteria bacterium]
MRTHHGNRITVTLIATIAGLTATTDGGRAYAQAPTERSVADRVAVDSPYAISADPAEAQFVQAAAEKAIAQNCASCHGPDLRGKPGVPNLVDYDWLWGITLEETNDVGPVMEIQQTILYGVRNNDCPAVADQAQYGGCPDTRYSEMPGYGKLGALTQAQIRDLTEYVLSLGNQPADAAAVARGETQWAVCTECHGADGRGYKPYGGPDLTDDIWLYGGDRAAIVDVIANGRLGTCPAWVYKLDEATIKSIAVYLWRKVQEG